MICQNTEGFHNSGYPCFGETSLTWKCRSACFFAFVSTSTHCRTVVFACCEVKISSLRHESFKGDIRGGHLTTYVEPTSSILDYLGACKLRWSALHPVLSSHASHRVLNTIGQGHICQSTLPEIAFDCRQRRISETPVSSQKVNGDYLFTKNASSLSRFQGRQQAPLF